MNFILYLTISFVLVCILGFFDGYYKIEWYTDTETDSRTSFYILFFLFWPLIIMALIFWIPMFAMIKIIEFFYNYGNKFNKKLDKN